MGRVTETENRHTGEWLRLERISPEEGEDIISIEGSIPAGGEGPPLHHHPRSREDFTVVSGLMGVQLGKEKSFVEAGRSATVDPGTPHTWWNAGEDKLVIKGQLDPAVDFDLFMEAMTRAMNATRTGRPPMIDAAYILDRYPEASRPDFIPKPVQVVLLPLALTVARLLGRSRRYDAE